MELDFDLLQRLGEMVWRFLNRIATIDWGQWSDTGTVLLTLTIIVLALIAAYIWRWWLAAGGAVAFFIIVGILLSGMPAPEPVLVQKPSPGIPWWVWFVAAAFLIFLAIWMFLGREGRREIRLRLLRRFMEAQALRWLFGEPTAEWQARLQPPAAPERPVETVETGEE